MKRKIVIYVFVLVSVIALVMFFLTREPKKEENVTLTQYNETIKELSTKISDMQIEIDTIIAVNTDLQAEIEELKILNSNLKKLVNSNTTNLTTITKKVNKMYGWHEKLYEIETHTPSWNDMYIRSNMTKFWANN